MLTNQRQSQLPVASAYVLLLRFTAPFLPTPNVLSSPFVLRFRIQDGVKNWRAVKPVAGRSQEQDL